MSTSYERIINIDTLDDVLSYIKGVDKPDNIAVWLDWDENIINSDSNTIIEPRITKELIRYMQDTNLFFSVITGRFWDTACNDKLRNLEDMQWNILYNMYPVMRQLGIDTERFNNDYYKNTVYKVFDGRECVGVLYMGIFFTGQKGKTIKNFLRQMNMNKQVNIFVDDYEPYLHETTTSFPSIVAFRRRYPYNYPHND